MSETNVHLNYLRNPTICGDQLVFVADDDLWTVSTSGGTARRLTTSLSEVGFPSLSPDGTMLAFTASDSGAPEVYVVASDGGEPKQLTYLGMFTQSVGWRPDGRVVFISDAAASPFSGITRCHAYTIDKDGGHPERLPWGPVHRIAFSPSGGVVIMRGYGRQPAHWKRYRGGTRGQFWVDADGSGQFTLWEMPGANLESPMWIGDRIFFLSDHEGIGNLYSALPSGADIRRHTDHDTYYARNAQTDGKRIVYHCGGDVYLFDPAEDETRLVPISLNSPKTRRTPKFVNVAKYREECALHPKGHSLLLTSRGHLFGFSNWKGPVLELGASQGVRYRLSQWLPGGDRIVTISDEGGDEALEVHAIDGTGVIDRFDDLDLGWVQRVAVSPVDDKVAVSNTRHELIVIDLKTRSTTLVEKNPYGEITGPAWSPDGAWLCYAAPWTNVPSFGQPSALKLWRDGSEPVQITEPILSDFAPAFDPDGKYLYFLSIRAFTPVYDTLQFELSFPGGGIKPCVITLQSDLVSPFQPAAEILGGSTEEDDAAKEKDSDNKENETKQVKIDLEDISRRVLPFPLPEGRYRQILGIKGKVLITSAPQPDPSADSSGDSGPRNSLLVYDLKTRKHETAATGIGWVDLSGDGKTMVLTYRDRVRVLPAGESPKKRDEKAKGKRDANPETGWVDLNRVTLAVEPQSEWRQMLREAWRRQRDEFWTKDLSNVDWDTVWERYSALLPRIGTRSELSDLMWEMHGELGTSHVYERGGDYGDRPNHKRGFLGADVAWDEQRRGYRIERLIQGVSGDEDSALRAPGLLLREGDVILSVDNRPTSETQPLGALLANKAKKEVLLRVASGDSVRSVTVMTLDAAGYRSALYREWVEQNRRKVHEASNGRLGYLHVPDMGPRGFAEFHRTWLLESRYDGLIVDVRFNGGGHVSQLLLEKLSRRSIADAVFREAPPVPYPLNSVSGPVVALVNEYAGSDADIFSHGFKTLGIGPVVGTRSWGGVIGISPRGTLVDKSVVSTPRVAFWFHNIGLGLENYGTDPDIVVYDRPEEYADGVDAQLERAIAEALEELERNPPQRRNFEPKPDLSLPKLPPRESEQGEGTA